MASVFVQFVPSNTQVFQFSPTLNGVVYQASVTYNLAGGRYYINIYDTAGDHILTRAVSSSGPRYQAAFTWANGFATATTTQPHNIPVGDSANLRFSETGTGFDGNYQALATTGVTLLYTIPNPEQTTSPTGTVMQPLNLVGGVVVGAWLLFHYDSLQFEYEG